MDIEINAWSPLFVNTKIALISSLLYPEKFLKFKKSECKVYSKLEAGKFDILRAIKKKTLIGLTPEGK